MKKQLIIAGSGIKTISHMSFEVIKCLEQSDLVLYLLNEPAQKEWVQKKSAKFECLDSIYLGSESRGAAYKSIANHVKKRALEHEKTTFVTYGHPTLMCTPSMRLLEICQANDLEITILPGISAEDCMIADLKIDPGTLGWQSYEAREFLIKKAIVDTAAPLALWQIGAIGVEKAVEASRKSNSESLTLLYKKLSAIYPGNHRCVIYEASIYPHFPHREVDINLEELPYAQITPITSLYVPPYALKAYDETFKKALEKILSGD